MKTPLKAELEARESREKVSAKRRLAADIMVVLVQRFGVLKPTPSEITDMTNAAHGYAAVFFADARS